MKQSSELNTLLRQIDHKGYPAYKQLRGEYQFPGYVLGIDHVQGDPFAAPSKVSIHVKGGQAAFPQELYRLACQKTALEDALLREMGKQLRGVSFQAKGSGKSGLMSVSTPGQEVLSRSGCQLDGRTGDILLRMEIGFPANGRSINARELEKILFDFLPKCVSHSLYYRALDAGKLKKTAELAEDQLAIRQMLADRGLVAFVANGSVLPRESGVSSRPMKQAVPFQSPASMEVELILPNKGTLRGMGIPRGITLIVGGGYHGKSTLLKALELGVYDHIAGDGREYVITDGTAVKLRAEDGRSVKNVDISYFINNLPNGKDTVKFCTEDASGSTSQAANVIEAMEAGSRVFLIDEDTSATNFMIRDELMQRVVHRELEPITPYIERVRELYENHGISTVLVAGSSGSYFHKADCILQMNRYVPADITDFAKEEAKAFPVLEEMPAEVQPSFERIFSQNRKLAGSDRIKMKTMGMDGISIDRETIDLRYLEQLADPEQLSMLAQIVKYAELNVLDGRKTLVQVVDILETQLTQKGFGGVCGERNVASGLAMPRRQEIFACLNRYRRL
ncbi:MAG: ABC-ATPase domain-containing protein [Eubacterium sp.]|jgi:predicted ABC-class ATPase|nr:ABC-ATPase domain-containing protein [Eubacterium sp.]